MSSVNIMILIVVFIYLLFSEDELVSEKYADYKYEHNIRKLTLQTKFIQL